MSLAVGTSKKKARKRAKTWPVVKRMKYRSGSVAWLVDTRLKGEGARIFKATEEEANEVARQARIKRQNAGTGYFTLENDDRLDAERALALLAPYGKSLLDAAQFFVPHLKALESSKSVVDATHAYEDNATARGLSKRHLKDIRLRLGKFCKTFGTRLIADVKAEELDRWLQELKVLQSTRNGYRRHLLTFWAFAENRKWCEGNEAAKTSLAKERGTDVGVLTIAETQRLLEVADLEILPVVAIGAFAGLRRAELEKLDWKDVDLVDRVVEVRASNAKTARRRTVHISDNLAEWITPLVKRSGSVWPGQGERGRNLLDAAKRAAGFGLPGSETTEEREAGVVLKSWPSNALRHGYASYHLAAFKDAAKLALEMGHSSTSVIFEHYRQVVRSAEAEKYWKIVPVSESDKILPMRRVL